VIELDASACRSFDDNQLDENYFPILWREDGYRTPQIETYLRQGQR
jgi:hypothetical protein